MADTKDQVHRDLVANLSDEQALHKMQRGWLDAGEWGPAIERVRASHFADLDVDEGNRRVGALIGESFLASDEGRIARESLETLPRDTLFGKLIPMLGERLRQSIRFEWDPAHDGVSSRMRVIGRRAAPAHVTLGFFQTIASVMPTPPSITIESLDDELMIMRVT